MSADGRHVIALDALLANPAALAALRSLLGSAPIAWQDQVDAAAGTWTAGFDQAGGDYTRHDRALSKVPDWIRLQILAATLSHIDGTASTCLHAPSARRPEPILAAAWRPGLIVCTRCAHLLALSGQAEHTCDRCGRVVALISSGAVQAGALLWTYGVCADCLPDDPSPEGATA